VVQSLTVQVAVVGHVEWVEFISVRSMPVVGEIVHAHSWHEEPGGGGAGAAVQLAKLAGGALFLTALGDDERGRLARARLEDLGVEVHAVVRPEPTRRAVTHIDATGERTITVLGDRLAPLGEDDLPWRRLASMDAVYFTAGDDAALRHARCAGVLVATARALPLLRSAGLELDALVGSAGDESEAFGASDVAPAPRACVWTNGANGGTYWTKSERGSYRAASAARIVDRYGAGDSFAAGLTYGLGVGMGLGRALDLAARCGAAVVAGRGPYEGQLRLTDL
jgi:ribokinase